MSTSPKSSILLNLASAFGLVLLVAAAAGSKSNGTASSDAGESTTASSSDDTEPKTSVCGKAVPNFEYIRGTCDNHGKAGQCDEYYGLTPKFAPDMCKTEGGTFVTTTPKPNPCPKANLIGTCHYKQSRAGEPGQFANYYSSNAQSATALKKECLDSPSKTTEWIDAPVPPAAAAPSASAPAKPAAKPQAKPAPAGSSKAK